MLSTLLNPNADTFEEAWNKFYMDVSLVRTIAQAISKDTAQQLIQAGLQWTGKAFNTTKASKIMYELSGVPMVKSSWLEYRNSFLYTLALLTEVEIQELDLSDRAAEAAFNLAQVFAGDGMEEDYANNLGSNPGTQGLFPNYPESVDEEEPVLSWDEPQADLPGPLQFLWTKTVSGERKLDLKSVLTTVPRFGQLPAAPPNNNHRGDGLLKKDKQEKAYQQTLLHSLRLLGNA